MLATIRDLRGQGDAALYVRARDVSARFWNFTAATWDAAESADCRVFLVEYQDADTVESRYLAGVTLPPDDAVLEYVRASDSLVIGEETTRSVSASLTGGGANPVTVQAVGPAGELVAGVTVQAWQGTNLLAQAVTGGTGQVLLLLPAATINLVLAAPSWGAFPLTTIAVSTGPQTVSIEGTTMAAPAAPADPDLCLVYEYLRNQDGTPAAKAKASAKITGLPANYEGALFTGAETAKVSDGTGYVSWLLPRGARIALTSKEFWTGIKLATVPAQETVRVSDLIA